VSTTTELHVVNFVVLYLVPSSTFALIARQIFSVSKSHLALCPCEHPKVAQTTYESYSYDYSILMVLETPLLRVSRPVAACSRCRAAKVKCDGKLPACTACEKSNRASECSGTNDQFARGKERSYVATLESRVERLEKRIQEARARRKSSVMMLDMAETATPRRASVDTVKATKPISKRAARRREASEIDDLVSDFGLL
jgi:hypothetical protein